MQKFDFSIFKVNSFEFSILYIFFVYSQKIPSSSFFIPLIISLAPHKSIKSHPFILYSFSRNLFKFQTKVFYNPFEESISRLLIARKASNSRGNIEHRFDVGTKSSHISQIIFSIICLLITLFL